MSTQRSALEDWQQFVREHGRSYVGGDIQENRGLGFLQGPIESIAVNDSLLVVRTRWTAVKTNGVWKMWKGNNLLGERMFVHDFNRDDSITPPTFDGRRVRFVFVTGEATIFPPGDSLQLPLLQVG